jgi:hypothetical protein
VPVIGETVQEAQEVVLLLLLLKDVVLVVEVDDVEIVELDGMLLLLALRTCKW